MISLDSRFAELRERFVASSRKKLGEIDASLDALERDPSDADAAWNLYHRFHGVAGTGGTYGFPEISDEGAEGERIADAIVKEGTATSDQLELLRGASKRIANALRDGFREQAEPAREVARPMTQLEMLIVSSDETLLGTVTALARAEGFASRAARTTGEARRIIATRVPAAILVDADINDASSYALIEELRTRPSGDSAFAAVTAGGGGFADNVQAIRCGADQFLPKPIDGESLRRRLRRFHDQLAGATPRVLLVEDDPDQAAFIIGVLETAGYRIQTCENPANFEALLAEFRPDLVLMEVVLAAAVDGHELAGRIRQHEQFASLPVIFLTIESRMDGTFAGTRSASGEYLTKPIAASLLVSSVATRIERARMLRGLLLQDGLTGLLTHSAFAERLRIAVAERQAHSSSAIALVMIDVDHFKAVNDTYGHPVGDKVLVSLAAFLRRRLRRSDSIARYAGEEFAFLLADVHEADAMRIVSAMIDDFAAMTHPAPGAASFRVTFSAGLSMLRAGDDVASWVTRAESALAAAKRAGRERVIAE